ncbi:MAG: pseudouridine synthase [Acidimicrobiia bacterium]
MAERPKLQKAIAHSGLMSRRAAEELIAQGRVSVDGEVAGLGDRVDPERERITIDGVPIPAKADQVTYLVYKPPGVICTASDPQGRTIVTDLVPAEPRVYPVGRLDSDSEGLILLSNDGELANLIMHPGHGVTKTYLVRVQGRPGGWISGLTDGVDIGRGPKARAVSARLVDSAAGQTLVEMVMMEGRNREIRRMCDALGHPVDRLVRTAIGPITDRDLIPGGWRHLSPVEITSLYRAGGTRPG